MSAVLGISPRTADKHKANIMKKLDIHNTGALTAFAIRELGAAFRRCGNSPGTLPKCIRWNVHTGSEGNHQDRLERSSDQDQTGSGFRRNS